jgi:hypothetical protein
MQLVVKNLPAFGNVRLVKAMKFAPLFCSLPVKPPKEEKLAVGRKKTKFISASDR